jgi:DNA-binding GntR family transcriptional regulator
MKTTRRADSGRTSRAYEQIYALIVFGRMPAGARIAEGALAESLGVSRTPIREALQRLRQEGLVIEVGGGDGLRGRLAVAPLQRERMEELYALAAAIEGLAVRGLSKVGVAQRESLALRLEAIEREFHAQAGRPTPEYDRLFELHRAFHSALVEEAAGPETRSVLRTIKPRMDRYEWFYAPMAGPDFTQTRTEHAVIVAAVRRGNAQQLQHAVRTNWLNAARRLGPLIERYDGRLPAGIPLFSISQQPSS